MEGSMYLLAVVYGFTFFINKKISETSFRDFIILAVFTYFSSLSSRNIPFYLIIFIFLVTRYSENIFNRVKFVKSGKFWSLPFLIIMVFIICARIPVQVKAIYESKDFSAHCAWIKCPKKAVEFIKKSRFRFNGNLINYFNWGGYLIWELKEHPIFIDGRMPAGEIFSEYKKIISLKTGWEEVLEKYNITWILVPERQLFNNVMLLSGSWIKIYSADGASIYVKNKGNQ